MKKAPGIVLKEFIEYREYPYDINEEGALIAEATCDYCNFHAKAKMTVQHLHYDIATFTRMCEVEYTKAGEKKKIINHLGYAEEEYKEIKRNLGIDDGLERHFMDNTIAEAYRCYRYGR